MAKKLYRLLGYIWAAPLTLVGLIYVLALTTHKRVTWLYVERGSLVWRFMPFHGQRHATWPGRTLGHVVVVNSEVHGVRGRAVMLHHHETARQMALWGLLWPVIYWLGWLVIKVTCRSSNPRYSHPFELEARRVAGQVIDVEGVVNKLRKNHT